MVLGEGRKKVKNNITNVFVLELGLLIFCVGAKDQILTSCMQGMCFTDKLQFQTVFSLRV